MALLEHTIALIRANKPKYFFIENPRGAMRKQLVMKKFNLVGVTYCQYGDTRMKPTDIFTNADIKLKPMCKNGDPCHVRAPRGSRTRGSTQGAKNAKDRAIVPEELCLEIIQFCEEHIK
jgi:site-specific DNA-cytosine methylase